MGAHRRGFSDSARSLLATVADYLLGALTVVEGAYASICGISSTAMRMMGGDKSQPSGGVDMA